MLWGKRSEPSPRSAGLGLGGWAASQFGLGRIPSDNVHQDARRDYFREYEECERSARWESLLLRDLTDILVITCLSCAVP